MLCASLLAANQAAVFRAVCRGAHAARAQARPSGSRRAAGRTYPEPARPGAGAAVFPTRWFPMPPAHSGMTGVSEGLDQGALYLMAKVSPGQPSPR
ncbi:hypothetical protein QW131_12110 [Roseibium salinum]|nr:hypothetical protein [Roseibium salinum]